MFHSLQTRSLGFLASAVKAQSPLTLLSAAMLIFGAMWVIATSGSSALMWHREQASSLTGLLFSGLSHFNSEHAWLNVVSGLILVLTFPFVPLTRWVALFFIASPIIALAIWAFSPFDTYAGASGALHAWFAAGCVTGLSLSRIRRFCGVCLTGMAVKLFLEASGLIAFSSLGGFAVAHVAHLTGALVGVAYATVCLVVLSKRSKVQLS